MKHKISQMFALSEQGAADLIKGTLWCALSNISLMFPMGLLILVIDHMLQALSNGTNPAAGVWGYTAAGAAILGLIFIIYNFKYKSIYLTTYKESANRRVRLAEKLRALPLSFFGKRDLSDLTTTIMTDCGSLEQAFSHYIPELFGAILSTILIAIGLFCMDWRSAIRS